MGVLFFEESPHHRRVETGRLPLAELPAGPRHPMHANRGSERSKRRFATERAEAFWWRRWSVAEVLFHAAMVLG